MAIYNEPSPFEYIGQGLQNAATPIAQALVQRSQTNDDQVRRDAQFIAQMVQSGAMDSDTANNTQAAQRLGLRFQPSATELRRKILANPAGTGGSPGGGPDDSGNITSPGTPATPWSSDQRFAAGLPSASSASVEDIKNRYIKDPSSVSDSEASVAGLATPSDLAIKKRQQLDPVISTAAQKYVGQVFNSTVSSSNGKIDPATPEGLRTLRRQSTNMAAAAYNQYITDAKASGDTVATDPKNQGYIRSFFDDEVAKQLKSAEEDVIRTKALTPQKSQMTAIDWSKQMRGNADDLEAEIAKLEKDPQYMMASTATDPSKLPPNLRDLVREIHLKDLEATAYRKASRAFLVSDPATVSKSLEQELSKIDALKSPGGAAPPPNTGQQPSKSQKVTPETLKEMAQRINTGKATIADAQAEVTRGNISAQDFATIMSQVQKPKPK